MDNKGKKYKININEEHEKKGLTLELRTIEKYEKLGYKVIYDETQDDKKEQGIDLVCNKDEQTFLIKCNNNSKSKSITAEDIKAFHKNAINYVKINNLKHDVKFRYVIHYEDALDKSARIILKDDYYNCRYVII